MEDYTVKKSSSENKRKRRSSSTQTDDLPKNKMPVKNTDASTAEEDRPHSVSVDTNNKESHSLFFLEELCDEVLYEIFKFLDTWSLMALMNVCRRFEKFVLDKRLWENIDLAQEPLPLGILEDMLERSHEKTGSIKLRGPSPSQHIDGEIKHFNKTIRNSFTTRCTKLVILELHGVTLDFDQISLKDFPPTLNRLVLSTCNVRMSSFKCLFSGIDTILVNLEELAIENNSWFDPYYVMALSKLPLLRYLSLKGCWQMQEFIPYGSIAARHGFKKLEILDLRNTPLSDSDLQCFNAVETLKEIYLQCPENENSEQGSACTQPQNGTVDSQSSNFFTESAQRNNETKEATTNELSLNNDTPSTSKGTINNDNKDEKTAETVATATPLIINDGESMSSSSSSSSSCSSHSVNTSSGSRPNNSSTRFSLSQNLIPLVGTNAPTHSQFRQRPDRIFYLDVRNSAVPEVVRLGIAQHNNLRLLRLPHQAQQQNQQNLPSPVIEQMMRHNLFWDIVNPLGGVVGMSRPPDRVLDEENEYQLNFFSLLSSNRQQSRGTISDRGVCCFGRTRQPVQQGVIWIRFNNRPSENRFERFSVRDYKFVTDVSLQHLVQCSPHLIFLDVSGTSVTLDGLQRFKDLKPECQVVAEHLLVVTKSETIVS